MKVYTLRSDVNKYRGFYYTNEDDVVEFNRRFDGRSMKNTWTGEEKFAFVTRRLPRGDISGLSSHIPVFNSKAVKALSDFLESNGELLPITCNAERYFVFNVTKVIDALDEDNCELKLFDGGAIMDVETFSFFPERLQGITLFKIPQLILADVFVTDPFWERGPGSKVERFPVSSGMEQ